MVQEPSDGIPLLRMDAKDPVGVANQGVSFICRILVKYYIAIGHLAPLSW